MIGFYSYYAVPTNFPSLNSFSREKEIARPARADALAGAAGLVV
jgi:hypothetical protein